MSNDQFSPWISPLSPQYDNYKMDPIWDSWTQTPDLFTETENTYFTNQNKITNPC